MNTKNSKKERVQKVSNKSQYILSVRDLSKTYNPGSERAVKALKEVSLDVSAGDFIALMGRSGSGKSTFLHQVALLDKATGGSIMFNGVRSDSMSEKEKADFRLASTGYIFQDYALLPELTMFENIALPMMALGVEKTKYTQDVLEVIKKVGLAGREDHLPGELSGGQQQRVSIARAIVNKPEILFADEPTASLDTASSLDVMKTLMDLVKNYGQTIIMVTHEPEDKKYVNRIVYMKDGELSDMH